jgi:hypothetical protein
VYAEPFGKPFDEIGPEDIKSLVDNESPEGLTLEYKEKLPVKKRKQDTVELLADVSSLANARGGHLIYGIGDKREQGQTTGRPVLVGLPIADVDSSIQKLESIMRTCIRPRIPQARMKHVPISDELCVILVWIPKTFASPHMISFESTTRFYSRNSRGKYQLDVDEIRQAFASPMDLAERIKRFRDDRIASILAGETPVRLLDDPKVVIHLVPLSAFDPAAGIDVTTGAVPLTQLVLQPNHNQHRYNLDGYLLSTQPGDPWWGYGYLQLFRSGVIELLDARWVRKAAGEKVIVSPTFEAWIAEVVREDLEAQLKLGLTLPFAVMVTVLDASGYRLSSKDYQYEVAPQIDRDFVPLPEVIVRELPFHPYRDLKPIFDAFWQACGRPRCPYCKGGAFSTQVEPGDW